MGSSTVFRAYLSSNDSSESVAVQSHTLSSVDLQGHGGTMEIRGRALSIEKYAEDVGGLLKYLRISKAEFFGESYGGNGH
jgi:hypothetical protein